MSLSDLASLGSFVSGVAVLASLVFLFFQMRQMTEQVKQSDKHQRSLMMQGRAWRKVELSLRRADPSSAPGLEKIMAGKIDALTAFELFQAFSAVSAEFASFEESWLECREGLLSRATQDTVERSIAYMFAVPMFRAAWPQVRPTFDPEFAALSDRLMNETTSAPPAALIDTFRRALVNEMAKVRTNAVGPGPTR
jgi:hypothetical protein